MDEKVQISYDSQRDFSNKAFRSACYAPFVSLYFNTSGNVLACCKNDTYILGNVAEQRLPEIWKGRKANGLRKALARYRFEAGCEFCEWQIAGGNYRSAFPWLFEEHPVQSMEPDWPRMIEFAGSNTCNFECIMCSGEFSSSIRERRDGLPPLRKMYSDQFFEDLREFLPHLAQAKFLGGEPFLAQECFRIWEMMIEDKLNICCHVTTNASQYNARVERVLQALPVSMTVSVDGATRETVEKIRVNSDFAEFEANISRFREYTRRRGTYMSFAHCLMRPNWHEFGDVLLWGESLGCEVFVNTVISPDEHSLYSLPPEELLRIVDEMEKQGPQLEGKLRINLRTWRDQLQTLRSNAQGRMTEKLTVLQNAIGEAYVKTEGTWRNITLAWELAGAGRYEDALAAAHKVPARDPKHYHAVALCGHVRRLMGDLEGSEEELARALEISRRRPEAYLHRAYLRQDQLRPAEGLEDLLHAHRLIRQGDEFEAELWSWLSDAYCEYGKFDEAAAALDRVLELKPENPGVRVQRAQAFRMAGLKEQANKEVEAALALDAECADAIKLRDELLV